MKRSNLKTVKKAGTIILILMFFFTFLAASNALAQTETGVGGGLGALETIGPLGIAGIAAGTLAAIIIIAESTTESDATPEHTTTSHHGD